MGRLHSTGMLFLFSLPDNLGNQARVKLGDGVLI